MPQKTQRDNNEQKTENRREVLNAFRRSQIITVLEIAELCGLSRPTAHRAVDYLRKKDLLVQVGKGVSGDEGGKKPALLAFNAGYKYVLCYQILANSLLAAVSDLRGTFLAEKNIAFDTDAGLGDIIGHMKNACAEMLSGLHLGLGHFAGVAVGCHGVTDAINGVIYGAPYFPSWGTNIPFQELVREGLETTLPIQIDNSNRFNAYAEMRAGRARGVRNFAIIDVETRGIGAGIVIDGSLWRGSNFLPGEIGHMTVDPTGSRLCTCGSRGCLETMASMNSLIDAASRGAAKHRDSLLSKKIASGALLYSDIYDIANAGDAFARSVVSEQARWLAIGISNLSLAADPEMIILQGPFSRGGDYFLRRLDLYLSEAGLPTVPKSLTLTYSEFGRERGLVGGAHYMADLYFRTLDLSK